MLFVSGTALGVEVHTLVNDRCEALSGVVVHVDEEYVLLVDLEGHSREWRRDDVRSIVLHKPVDNPIAIIMLDDRLRSQLFNVYLVDSDGLAFTGWPIGFIEELIVFYDLYGRTHVLALEDIDSMIIPSPVDVVYPTHAASQLHFPADYIECANLVNQAGLPPARIIGDRVKVGDYFDTFEAHYRDLESFRERTFLYAKPFLYDKRTRLGLIYMRHRGPLIPAYLHFSTGRPYAFQSFLLLGGAPVMWLPTIDPNVVLWSDLKSHVFHASFIANPFAIPAGTNTLVNAVQQPRTEADFHTESSFNYLILMGVDYGPWSASVGPHYPTRFFRLLPRSMEITATGAGLALRARATFDHLAFRLLYFRWRQTEHDGDGLRADGGPNFDESAPGGAGDPASDAPTNVAQWPPPYRIKEDTLRAGVSADAFDTELNADLVYRRGEYAEEPLLDFALRHYELGLTLSREFGHYVRMNVHTNYHRERDEAVGEQSGKNAKTWTQFDYGGAFEFQF